MWRYSALTAVFMLLPWSVVAATPPTHDIKSDVVSVVRAYTQSIACDVSEIASADVITLSPWTTDANRPDAEYAVIWGGSIGCGGGNGTYGYGIAVVKIGAGNTVLVDPRLSSPTVRLDSPAQEVRLINASSNQLVLEGKDYVPNDPRCCPSLTVQMTVKRNSEGNWLMEEKKILSPQP